MNSLIHSLNHSADLALHFAWPMLWQSSLLIAALFLLDFALRRKVRAAVRYALWLVVLIKLILPPSLALPTSIAWWLRPTSPAPIVIQQEPVTITYGPMVLPAEPILFTPPQAPPLPKPHLTFPALVLLLSSSVSLALFVFMLFRWRQILRHIHQTHPSPDWLNDLLETTRRQIGLRQPVRLRLTDQSISPAVCGLFRPLILLPASLAADLPRPQLRAVLLHELVHLRRRDVWLNCAQSLLQIIYWWHPLLWLANARIRRLREEAVDDVVMLALRDECEIYAPTLLEVAKLAFHRPLASLGLVGILESKRALRQRIERLIEFEPPRRAGLTLASVMGIAALTCIAVPQGEAPPKATKLQFEQVSTGLSASQPGLHADEGMNEVVEVEPLSPQSKLQYDRATGLTICSKGVRIKYETVVLTADQATVNRDTGEVIAEGNVRIGDGDKWMESRLIHFHLREAAGNFLKTNDIFLSNTARAKLLRRSKASAAIGQKLIEIRMDVPALDNVPILDLVRDLSEQSRLKDPDKEGVNFFLKPFSASIGGSTPSVNLAELGVTLKNPLTNARLTDVASAITESAARPISYTVMDNGVMFSPTALRRNVSELVLRSFRVDPNTVLQYLERTIGAVPGSLSSAIRRGSSPNIQLVHDLDDPPTVARLVRTNADSAASAVLRDVLRSRGVDLTPPKALFWNERQGTILIRATMRDLDTVGKTIALMNIEPPQINIKATFVSLSPKAAPALWKSLGITNKLNSPESIVLTSTQAMTALKAIKSQKGIEILAEPQVTTLAGRQAQLQIADAQTIVTGVTNGTKEPTFLTENVHFGPVLDVTPNFVPDSFAVNLMTVASVNEFLGYDDPKNEKIEVLVNGKPTRVKPPHPRFRTAQMVFTNLTVLDGQTVVLGNATPVEQVSGQMVKPDSKSEATRKSLIVFLTPTLVDPTGNPYGTKAPSIPKSKSIVAPSPAKRMLER